MSRLPANAIDVAIPELRGPEKLRDFESRLAAIERGMGYYDSGWQSDSLAAGSGLRTYTHNLGLTKPPRAYKLWFSPDQAIWYPVAENRGMGTTTMAASAAATYHNPGVVILGANNVQIGVYVDSGTTGTPLFSGYTGAAWLNYNTGYWRYYLWR